jgi:hypothetical protein
VGLHRVQRPSGDRGDLLEGTLAEEPQRDRLPIGLGEVRDRAARRLEALGTKGRLLAAFFITPAAK